MEIPKITAMLRVKNEERWIGKTLEAASEICDSIVIVDNHSSDNTVKICKSFPKVVEIHEQDLPFNDARDKNTLLPMALKQNPDFIFTLDGDEVILLDTVEPFLEEINILYPHKNVFEMQLFYIWDKPNQYRYDGVYSKFWTKKLLRIKDQPSDLRFSKTDYPGDAHCPHVPQNCIGYDDSIRSSLKILHYGNYDESLRHKKYEFYNRTQPSPKEFDNYTHIVSGEGWYSGPGGIQLKILPEGKYISDID